MCYNQNYTTFLIKLFMRVWVGREMALSKKEGKDQESIQSSTTPGPGYQWESDNVTIRHHKREQRGQPFPAGDHKASTNRRA